MKVIDLLNKIANDEESDTITEFEFDKRIWNFFKLQDSEYCLDKWLLNQEIAITKHKEIIEEEKKIEKLDIIKDYSGNGGMLINQMATTDYQMVQVANKINEIIDKINGEDKE